MARFVVRRLLQVVPTLLLLSVLVFAWLRSLPGGPAGALLGDKATPEKIAALNHVLGLDQPIWLQYLRFLGRAATGDFGSSLISGDSVLAEIGRALPATIELSVAAIVIAVGLGVPLGSLAASRHGRFTDSATVMGTLVGVAVPVFFLGYLLKAVFAVWLGWLPPSGRLSVGLDATRVTGFAVLDGLLTREFDASLDALAHLVLPAVALATIPLAVIVRITRASVLDVLGSDFVRTARAKGLAPGTVSGRHVLRNALLPVSTTIGLQTGLLLAGAVLTEKVFVWGGIGTLLAEGISRHDYPRLQALLLLGAVVYVLINLLVDVSYAVIDPRVRLS
jgi:peptide/nickel transport system permease protein